MIKCLCDDIKFIEEELIPHSIYKDYEIKSSVRLNNEGNPVILIKNINKMKSHQYCISRLIMEMSINRNLNKNEIIKFKDGNKLNCRLDNMILTEREPDKNCKVEHHICPICGKEFDLSGSRLSSVNTKRRRQGNLYSGPYCSSVCASRHNVANAFK